jgi:hypothetical protein
VIAVGINHYSTGREFVELGLYFYAWGYKEDPRLHRTPTDPRSIRLGVVWEFVNRTKTASDKIYRGLPNGSGISQVTDDNAG